jgi:ADP-heptose:LPS heptosyltransferase
VGDTVANGFAIFSVTYIGDLVLATLTFDALWKESKQPLTVVTAPAPATLLTADPRVRAVRLVRSSRALVWRVEVVREFARAKRAGERIINLEVYPPRWGFLRALCRWGSCEARAIDLPSLQADERNALRKARVALPHRSAYYAGAVGLPTDDPPRPRLKLPPAALARIAARLDASRVDGSLPLVVAHPGSSSHARRAPLPLFAETLARIAAERPVAIAVVGNAAEKLLAASLLEALPSTLHAGSWAGELSLVETAALLARADLFVGNDSGPLKLAEAVETPTLSFWGPSAPSFAGPRGELHRAAHFEDRPAAAAADAIALLDHPRSGSAG